MVYSAIGWATAGRPYGFAFPIFFAVNVLSYLIKLPGVVA
jgi:hypothetical protein